MDVWENALVGLLDKPFSPTDSEDRALLIRLFEELTGQRLMDAPSQLRPGVGLLDLGEMENAEGAIRSGVFLRMPVARFSRVAGSFDLFLYRDR